MPHVVIVGGGISGLALAYRLQEIAPSIRITLLEKASRPGGNIWTERLDGFQVESGPNGFLDSKPTTVELCKDLGLGERLLSSSEAARKNRYVFWRGKLQALPNSSWSFLTSRLLSWRAKINLLLESYRRRPPLAPAEESVAQFARRRAGKEVAALFADALVTGIHAGDPERLSIRAAFPRVWQMEQEHGSVMRGFGRASRQRRAEAVARGLEPQPPRMWSFREGLRLLVETLRERIGSSFEAGTTVRAVQKHPAGPGRWVVRGEGQQTWEADAVVLTCPAYEQAALLSDLDSVLANELGGIRYNRIAVVALGYRATDVGKTPDGFGYIAPSATRRDLLGVQWCSAIFPDRAPAGYVLWRALCGGVMRPEVVDWDDRTIVEAVRRELAIASGVHAEPVFWHVVRWPRALPQYELGHLDRIGRIRSRLTRHPGLFLGGNVYSGVAMNDCVEQAAEYAGRLRDYLNR